MTFGTRSDGENGDLDGREAHHCGGDNARQCRSGTKGLTKTKQTKARRGVRVAEYRDSEAPRSPRQSHPSATSRPRREPRRTASRGVTPRRSAPSRARGIHGRGRSPAKGTGGARRGDTPRPRQHTPLNAINSPLLGAALIRRDRYSGDAGRAHDAGGSNCVGVRMSLGMPFLSSFPFPGVRTAPRAFTAQQQQHPAGNTPRLGRHARDGVAPAPTPPAALPPAPPQPSPSPARTPDAPRAEQRCSPSP